ncbi:nuclear factor of activated T-cells, cytoplasmic 4 isoform X3 [Takifugu rubripes]|uniref:nuclear factor of activated T-cells, cytoplasmic 4 isoform X3 n=1 Tax=Takifugu rubripes TaxID=31033 RepID=UPI0005D2A4A6|nr:nuclear factor of activated T-cells, cytoplasmic 4 isoform X3 [Takifugu rubripes]XP_056913636.1 nuclear factor of activated T-cells, cytoplasmic 4 isoform X3 [Takifugu flavidus]|eukprot:XP_011617868.1 PREDICTED: nuclear factor of activated T-cells, cytoplasmic 4-like isoform X4 [Takifugu rubripes]
MGAAPGAGWDEGEFEFKLVFEEESQGPSPVRTSEPDNSGNPEKNEDTLLDYPDTRNLVADNHLATSHDEHLIIIPSPPPLVSQQAGMNSPPPRRAAIREFIGTYESLPARSVQVSESRVVECPSIQITTISPEDDPPSTVSRPTSPGGKKRRNTPFASPDTRRSSYSEDLHGCDLEGGDSINLTQAQPISCELSIPQKTRKTSLGQLSPREVDQEQSPGPSSPCLLSETQKTRREPPSLGMDYLSVPPALAWGRARVNTHSPLFRSNALPPLDWPLPSQFDQYELRIEVQPRPHHRAHYETEGSRGAVKATPTGHPVVKLCGFTERKPLSLQVFVGTADDRSIRPHPFYQIHRVTGKMVGTASHESVQAGTKLLDIPLTPENNMTVLIDCAGILKLRNSDIELRKGETDVGRKNTRVRLVFRVHLPLAPPVAPSGRVLALQVASLPIECSQRSAQELPVIESISLTSCSVEGGEELMLSGSNFLPVSRVLFTERGTDGKFQWEEEAHVDRDNSNECLLCVRIPTYSDLSIARPVSVNLYVSNGKRKRSSTHCFKYLPIMFKEEDPLLSSLQPSAQHLDRGTVCQLAGQRSIDRGFHMRSDPMNKDRGLGFHFSPYPSTYSPPCPTMSCPDDYISKPDVVLEEPRAILSERHPSFENLELGFTELLPPLYSRGPQAHSPSPWLDSPYLSSSPSPSHSSSFSPFPASSPISTSPLPPIPTSPYLQCSPYPQEVCSSPPSRPSPYQNISSTPYSQYDSWEMQGGAVETEYVRERAEKIQECPLEFNSSASMHHITFDEVTQLIGEDIHSYQSQMNN